MVAEDVNVGVPACDEDLNKLPPVPTKGEKVADDEDGVTACLDCVDARDLLVLLPLRERGENVEEASEGGDFIADNGVLVMDQPEPPKDDEGVFIVFIVGRLGIY
ncbi:hypothetical protein B7494_g4421 [Chlorociboria aeruginascens]|nr:hypothetical protein B7494_g4421 [Chlorociboria aeruginascens]